MSGFRDNLKKDFQDREYREAYAEDFLNTSTAVQIRVIREQRGLSQTQLGELIGTKQEGVSRLENVNHSSWRIDTLKKIAFALGGRLRVSIETYGSLIDEAEIFERETLQRPDFENDPVFIYSEADLDYVVEGTVTSRIVENQSSASAPTDPGEFEEIAYMAGEQLHQDTMGTGNAVGATTYP